MSSLLLIAHDCATAFKCFACRKACRKAKHFKHKYDVDSGLLKIGVNLDLRSAIVCNSSVR